MGWPPEVSRKLLKSLPGYIMAENLYLSFSLLPHPFESKNEGAGVKQVKSPDCNHSRKNIYCIRAVLH
jgi:hypothetical protein